MSACEAYSLIKPTLLNLSGSGLQLGEAIIEHNLERPGETYSGEETSAPHVGNPKHIVVLPTGSPRKLEWKIGGTHRQALFAEGDLILNPAGLFTEPHWARETELVLFAVGSSLVNRTAEQIGRSPRIELIPRYQFQDQLLRHLALTLLAEFAQDAPPDLVYAQSLTHTLVAHLIRFYSVEGMEPPTTKGGLPSRTLQRVTDYIHDRLGDALTLEDIAGVAGYSPSHFIALFKESTGRTPHQYVITKRLERAKRLLTQSEEPIASIALETGFADQSHLTRMMRRRVGVTPGALRAS